MTYNEKTKKLNNKTLKNKMKTTQNQYLKRKGLNYEVIDDKWLEKKGQLCTLTKIINENDTSYFISRRGKDFFETTLDRPSTSLKDAKAMFEEMTSIVRTTKLSIVDNMYPIVKIFIKKYKEEGAAGDYSRYKDLYTIQFIIALAELTEHGFDLNEKHYPGSRTRSKEFKQRTIRLHRLVLRHFDNIEITSKNHNLKSEIKEGMTRLISRKLSVRTFDGYFDQIRRSLKLVADAYSDIYPDAHNIHKQLLSLQKNIIKDNVISPNNPTGLLKLRANFEMINIDHLDSILKSASNYSLPVYNFIILSLSTMLRPSEVRRLCENPTSFIINDFHLDYSNGFKNLIVKTLNPYSSSKLSNPAISIISAVLLKNKENLPTKKEMKLVKNFFKKDGVFRKNELADYHERCLRTTGGHMLAYCEKAKDPNSRATTYTVKERMGHKNTNMAITIYAKHSPHQSMAPETYFDCNGINRKGKLITKHQTLWDSYLLQHWILTMMKKLSVKNMNLVWEIIERESKLFQSIVTSGQEDRKPLEL